jgi:hypothetical protein
MTKHTLPIDGVEVPAFFYGTAWKEEQFLQTKFTFRRGQDHRLPYDPKAAIPVQVEQ